MQKLCVDRARGPRSGPLFTFMYTDMSATIWNTNWGCLGTSNVVHLPFSDATLRYCYGKYNEGIFFLSVALREHCSNLVIHKIVIGLVTDLQEVRLSSK